MRKTLSILLSAALCFCIALSSTAAAIDEEAACSTASEPVYVTYTNEYEYAQLLESATEVELGALGLTQEEADEYLLTFKEALDARAALSEEELLGMGYTEEEIDIFKRYAAGDALSDAELTAISGTCTGELCCLRGSKKNVKFYYHWKWSGLPLISLSDSAAVAWHAYDSKGYEINVLETHSSTIAYYRLTDVYDHNSSPTEEKGLTFDAINVQFSMTETTSDLYGNKNKLYAKYGTISVELTVDSSVDNSINYVLVAAIYGHTEIGLSLPSVGVSFDGMPSISFSGNKVITTLAADKMKINKNGTYSHL